MPHFKIKHRYTGAVIFEGKAATLADLIGTAVKQEANLQWAKLQWANLQGAKLHKGEVLSLSVLSDLYKYPILVYVLKEGFTPCVKMGCLDFTLEEWEAKGGVLQSNLGEFPADGGFISQQRRRAFEYAKVEALAMVELLKK